MTASLSTESTSTSPADSTLLATQDVGAEEFAVRKMDGASHQQHKHENNLQHVGKILGSTRRNVTPSPHQVEVQLHKGGANGGTEGVLLPSADTKHVIKGMHHAPSPKFRAHKKDEKDHFANRKGKQDGWKAEAAEALQDYRMQADDEAESA